MTTIVEDKLKKIIELIQFLEKTCVNMKAVQVEL